MVDWSVVISAVCFAFFFSAIKFFFEKKEGEKLFSKNTLLEVGFLSVFILLTNRLLDLL
ncbi:hypothetical protein G159_03955 [Planococcus glaciei CHR43]|nr:hypothetical protein G159_03955 [Planococcus glaciei CHR43]